MTNLSKNSTNAEVVSVFGENLNDGKARVFAIEPTKNEGYNSIFLCQLVDNGTTASDSQNFFLGWNKNRLVRAIHNAAVGIANAMNIGDTVPFDILIEEKFTPAFATQEPKQYPSTHPNAGQNILINGAPIYEHGSLVEIGKGGIVRLERPVVEPVTVKVTSKVAVAAEVEQKA